MAKNCIYKTQTSAIFESTCIRFQAIETIQNPFCSWLFYSSEPRQSFSWPKCRKLNALSFKQRLLLLDCYV